MNSAFRYVAEKLMGSGQTPKLFSRNAETADLVISNILNLRGSHKTIGFRLWKEGTLLSNLGPTYILDKEFRFLDWNSSFDSLIASPLRLMRGTHVRPFSRSWPTGRMR